jgi:hypothetical protein
MNPQTNPEPRRRISPLKQGAVIALLACAILAPPASPAQNAVGFSFAGRRSTTIIAQDFLAKDYAGAVAQQNWNNVGVYRNIFGTEAQITSPLWGKVVDNSGAPNGMTLSYSSFATCWSMTTTYGATGNAQLMNGYLDLSDTASNGVINLSGIPYTTYDVYVYLSGTAGTTVSVGTNGVTQYYAKIYSAQYTNLYRGLATSLDTATNAHYVRFENVSGPSLEIDVTRRQANAGCAAVQIVDRSASPSGPAFAFKPTAQTRYVGGTLQYYTSLTDTNTGGYLWQWQKGGVNLADDGRISGSGSNVLTISNLTAADAGDYTVAAVSKSGGAAVTSAAGTLTVRAPVGGSFEECLYTNNPMLYYRMNETVDCSTTADVPVRDYIGGNDATYSSLMLNGGSGIVGPQPTDGLPGFETGNLGSSYYFGYDSSFVLLPAPGLNITTNVLTIAAWVKPNTGGNSYAGILFHRNACVAGLGYSSASDADGNYYLGYNWNDEYATYRWSSGLTLPANQWSFVALVLTPTNATIYLAGTNGLQGSVHNYPHSALPLRGPVTIGNDLYVNTGQRVFNGAIDELSVFKSALSQQQILSLVSASSGQVNFAPTILSQPVAQAPNALQNATFSVSAFGAAPLTYQWQALGRDGAYANLADGGRVAGSQTATLSLRSVAVSDPTNYILILSNLYGSVTSAPARLQVSADCNYANAVVASGPLAYYDFNETIDPADAGTVAFDYSGGYSGIYGTATKNGNANYAITGPQAVDGFGGFTTNNWAVQTLNGNSAGNVPVSSWNIKTNTVTMICWIKPRGFPANYCGLVNCRNLPANTFQAGLYMNAKSNQTAGGWAKCVSYAWTNGASNTATATGIYAPSNMWSFLAMVITPTNGSLYMFNSNGAAAFYQNGTHPVTDLSGALSYIGCDPYSTSGRNFDGAIDGVAIYNRSLSGSELIGLYAAAGPAGIAPTTLALGSSRNPAYAGESVTFTATLSGMPSQTPTGTVTFYLGTTNLGSSPVANGSAALTTNALPTGTYSIKAVYSGDPANSASTSMALSQKMAGPLSMSNPQLAGGAFVFSVPTFSGISYQVVYKTNLNDAAWTPLGGQISGTGATVSVTNTLPADKCFYRVQVVQ